MSIKLVLASASPRRRKLLENAGLEFSVRPADVDESRRPAESPLGYVERLAETKARAVWRAGELTLGADTTVVASGEILGKPATGVETTKVFFRALSESEIAAYAASGEPLDKAGAYGIQGLASKFVERVEGCYFNVVGLPVARVFSLIAELTPTPGRR